jgi:cutinase
MSSRGIMIAIGVGTALVSASMTMPPSAGAVGCPDAEVIFARGTSEEPGAGPTGEAFVQALRTRVGVKSLDVYPVDYPATTDFPTAVQGIRDARAHILATATNCPVTKMVLGGFSQGAAVMGFVTANVVPDGVSAADVPAPLPPDVADHVAAVALLGKPSTRFMHAINDPPVTIGVQYVPKTVDLCVDNDLVCDVSGRSFSAHNQYLEAGLVDQAAAFAGGQLLTSWASDSVAAPSELAPSAPSEPGPWSARHASGAPFAEGPGPVAPTPIPAGPLPGPAPIDGQPSTDASR